MAILQLNKHDGKTHTRPYPCPVVIPVNSFMEKVPAKCPRGQDRCVGGVKNAHYADNRNTHGEQSSQSRRSSGCRNIQSELVDNGYNHGTGEHRRKPDSRYGISEELPRYPEDPPGYRGMVVIA